ncbi:MAG: glycosyltransferase [Halobacteriota archaeon]|nr:glycosyltransferase [Halobacteriota archaeon]
MDKDGVDMRVLHSPINIAGQASIIAKAQRELGVESDVLVFDQNIFGYDYDVNLSLSEKPLHIALIVKSINFCRCLFKYDVFHFHFARTLLPKNIDLPILKLFGKKVVMTYWGDDIRQLDIAKKFKYHYAREVNSDSNVEDRKRRKIRRIDRYVGATITGYELLEFAPYSHITELAIDLSKNPFIGLNKGIDSKPNVVHAPTNRIIKGTKYIISAIERLKDEGYDFNFILVEDRSHEEALEIYNSADIIVDQLLIGTYGCFAVECMAMGKPVLCFIRDEMKAYHPEIPILSTNPDNVYDNIKLLIENPSMREELGIKGRKYVEEVHDSKIIAKQMIELYESI